MKKAAIISCNDNYDYDTRTKYVCKYLEDAGYEVDFVIADYDHRNKRKYVAVHPGNIEYIKVREYKKNLSIARILSHIEFANGVKKLLSERNYDLVYHCAPPNSTIRRISQLKRKSSFKLITEIGDMWPETMPVNITIKKLGWLPFCVWKKLRDSYLYNSDVVIAECNLFKNQLINNTGLRQIHTVYFCKEAKYLENCSFDSLQDVVELCYLGSINNIIDYDIVASLVKQISEKRPVRIHIIGDGEKRDDMIESLKNAGGEVCFHGVIFDDEKKKEIFAKCHYALNVMKSDVYVGMTMKSLDYFSFGIPMINNIGADIGEMVMKYNLGFNINSDNCEVVADKILCMTVHEYECIRKNVCNVHKTYFSLNSFYNNMDNLIGGKNEKNTGV